jgi:hypothetical protein
MLKSIEIFHDALKGSGDNCLVQRRKEHSRHEAAENDHNLAV